MDYDQIKQDINSEEKALSEYTRPDKFQKINIVFATFTRTCKTRMNAQHFSFSE